MITEISNGVTNKNRTQKNKQTEESHSHSSRYLGTVGLILKAAIKYVDSNFVKYKYWILSHNFLYNEENSIYKDFSEESIPLVNGRSNIYSISNHLT